MVIQWGAYAGALSMRQAIDAAMQGVSLPEYAKDHKELAAVDTYWGKEDASDLFDSKK